jgi:hypothetical protein
VKGWLRLLALACLAAACSTQRAERLFLAGDFSAAIDAYEAYLERRAVWTPSDASILLRLALAYSESGSASHDPERSEHYLRLLIDRFPDSPQTSEAQWLLTAASAQRRVGELEHELTLRDERLARLNAVLQLLAEAENRLRSEVADEGEARADLEGRLETLSRRARSLADEVAALEAELDALKQIDMESFAPGEEGPP